MTGAMGPGPRWSLLDRGALVAVLVPLALGTPGLGPETREADTTTVAIGMIVLVGPSLLAFILSWPRPTLAARLGILAGGLLLALAVLDILGLLIGPPPTGMIAVDALMGIIGAVVAVRSWRLLRR